MTYFVAAQAFPLQTGDTGQKSAAPTSRLQPAPPLGPRIGITAGKVLGNAVERNRIKRRMREAIRRHRAELTANVDVIFHPRQAVLQAEFSAIEQDVVQALHWIERAGRF